MKYINNINGLFKESQHGLNVDKVLAQHRVVGAKEPKRLIQYKPVEMEMGVGDGDLLDAHRRQEILLDLHE